MKKILQCLATSLVLSTAAYAEQARWFEVELLLFKHSPGEQAKEEKFAQSDLTLTDKTYNDLIVNQLILPPEQTRYLLPPCEEIESDTEAFFLQNILFYGDQPAWMYDNLCQMPEPSALNPNKKDLLALENSVFIQQVPYRLSGSSEHQPEQHAYLIDSADFKLTDLYAKLRWRKDMQPLLHFAWRQAIGDSKAEIPWRIMAGKNYQLMYQADGQPIVAQKDKSSAQETEQIADDSQQELTAAEQHQQLIHKVTTIAKQIEEQQIDITEYIAAKPPLEKQAIENKPIQETPVWQLDGLFKIYVEHYLYIESDFTIRKVGPHPSELARQPNLTEHSSIAGLTHAKTFLYPYQFNQKRRIRSTEIHYFDHPEMGIVLQVRRFTPPSNKLN